MHLREGLVRTFDRAMTRAEGMRQKILLPGLWVRAFPVNVFPPQVFAFRESRCIRTERCARGALVVPAGGQDCCAERIVTRLRKPGQLTVKPVLYTVWMPGY